MCKYCDITGHAGENIELEGEDPEFDNDEDIAMYIFKDAELASYAIHVDTEESSFRVRITFCPVCGKELIYGV